MTVKFVRAFCLPIQSFTRKLRTCGLFQNFLHMPGGPCCDFAHHKLHTTAHVLSFHLMTLKNHGIHPSASNQQVLTLSRQFKRTDEIQPVTLNNRKRKPEKNSTEYFQKIACVLNCSVDEVKKLSDKNKFLHHLHPDLLKEKIDLILSYEVPHSDILQNIRVCYKISAKLLHERLDLLQKLSLLHSNNIRFLEGEKKDFDQAVKYLCKKKQALEGSANFSEYIQHRFQCTEQEATKMLSSPPFTKGYTSIKLKTITDFFLQEANVSPQFLLENSFLYSFSVKRLRHRLEIMNEVGISDPFVMKKVWFYSNKRFNAKFKKYLKMNQS